MALNSFSFVLITVAAILVCRLCAPRLMRELVVLLLSVYFLSTFITEWDQLALLVALLAMVYLLGVTKAANASFWSTAISFLIVALFWAALFLLKDPSLLSTINPFYAHPIKLIGISYIVFRAITFVLEVAPGDRLRPLTFLNYMIFFPTLLAGPIERFHRFNETTDQPVALEPDSFNALNRVLNGFIKKFVLADNFMDLGIFSMMSHANDLSTPVLWIGALSTLVLLYLDFSGYCDIVIGVAALMGFRIAENFNAPFASRNLQEFWGRWHMSLGSVIQDYVFSPLSKAVIVNVPRDKQMYAIASIYVVTMILVAMWHGTTVGFLIFGILQGAVLFAIQILREFARARAKAAGVRYAPSQTALSLWAGRIATYAFVSLTMIWWQGSLPDAISTYQRLIGWR